MPGEFSRKADMQYPRGSLQRNIVDAVGADSAYFVEAGRIATALLGDSIAANMFMLGVAYQQGLIPVSAQAIEQAIELNGAQQQMNREAFLWGRRTVVDPNAVERTLATLKATQGASLSPAVIEDPDEAIAWRKGFLTDYQDAAYAAQYSDYVEQVRSVERSSFPGRSALTRAVAKYLFKLMAIKDEYEVARLYVDGAFAQALGEQFEGWDGLKVHMAPPFLSALGARFRRADGTPRKIAVDARWLMPVLRVLARARRMRFGPLDLFGRSRERRIERALVDEYRAIVESLLPGLDASRLPLALRIAQVPGRIRGFGHVKLASVATARAQWRELTDRWARGELSGADTAPLEQAAAPARGEQVVRVLRRARADAP